MTWRSLDSCLAKPGCLVAETSITSKLHRGGLPGSFVWFFPFLFIDAETTGPTHKKVWGNVYRFMLKWSLLVIVLVWYHWLHRGNLLGLEMCQDDLIILLEPVPRTHSLSTFNRWTKSKAFLGKHDTQKLATILPVDSGSMFVTGFDLSWNVFCKARDSLTHPFRTRRTKCSCQGRAWKSCESHVIIEIRCVFNW